MYKAFSSSVIIISIFFQSLVYGSDQNRKTKISDFALPSQVGEIKKDSGSVFYSPTGRKKVLMPVNFWGEIKQSGVHYIPVDSNLVTGLSLAGGPTGRAKLDTIVVSRFSKGKERRQIYDFSEPTEITLAQLNPGDTVFIERDTSIEDRTFYTGLVSIAFTILSSILIIQQLNDD